LLAPEHASAIGTPLARTATLLGEDPRLRLTTAAPGASLDETIELLEQLLPLYDQAILLGPPAVLEDIVDLGAARGLDWPRHRVHLLCLGEGFSESWRENMARHLGIRHIGNRREGQIIPAGACTDVNLAASETALSLLIGRLAVQHRDIASALFGETANVPMLYQHEPGRSYVECVDGELVVTVSGVMPLVRYNTHRRGGTVEFDHALQTLRNHGYPPRKLLRDLGWPPSVIRPLPLLYVLGEPGDLRASAPAVGSTQSVGTAAACEQMV
jgi:phenylacetate-CoA ligase